MRHLAYLLSRQGQYDEALKLGKEMRSKLELAFTFEASDRLNELERIMKEYVTFCTCNHSVCIHNLYMMFTCSIKEERAEKLRKEEEERRRKEMERIRAEQIMLREQEEARRRVPKAPPPPPVVELHEESYFEDYEELENIVLDTGMHTVKVCAASCCTNHEISFMFLCDRLVWLVKMLLLEFSPHLLEDQDMWLVPTYSFDHPPYTNTITHIHTPYIGCDGGYGTKRCLCW